MTSVRKLAALGLALVGLPVRLHAQNATVLLGDGIAAYERLDLDAAAHLLRAALTSGSLAPSLQTRGLAYLGATELYRSRPDSARAAFRRLLDLDAAYRLDARTFPPQVTDLFDGLRRGAHPLTVSLPPVSRFRLRSESLHIRVQGPGVATRASARLEREDGALVRQLFDGVLGDSLLLAWDGLDASAGLVPPGRYRLVVALVASATTTSEKAVRLPLAIEQWVAPPGTPPLAPAPAAAPQWVPQRSSGRGWPTLIAGIVAATAAATLPHAISPGVADSRGRLVVPITIATAGLVGFLFQQRAHPPALPPAGVATRTPPAPPSDGIMIVVHAGAVAAQ